MGPSRAARTRNFQCKRCAGVIWLLFLVGHLYLIDVWLGEIQRTNTIKVHCLQEIGLRFSILSTKSIIPILRDIIPSYAVLKFSMIM